MSPIAGSCNLESSHQITACVLLPTSTNDTAFIPRAATSCPLAYVAVACPLSASQLALQPNSYALLRSVPQVPLTPSIQSRNRAITLPPAEEAMLSLRQGAETSSSVPAGSLLRQRRVHVREHQRPQDALHATPAPASPTRGATALFRHVGLRATVVCSRRELDAASAHHHRVRRVRDVLRARTVVNGRGGPFPRVLFLLFVAAQRPVLTRRAPPRRLYALAPRYVCGGFVYNLRPALPTFLSFSLRFYVRLRRCPYLQHPDADTGADGLDASWSYHFWTISSTGDAPCAISFWGNLAGGPFFSSVDGRGGSGYVRNGRSGYFIPGWDNAVRGCDTHTRCEMHGGCTYVPMQLCTAPIHVQYIPQVPRAVIFSLAGRFIDIG
ncbi:hypothetical protein B0H13DRAFT_2360480 [Mycena leptocephala]|nr:hypothetical protein B0H13DRAFT_2360480 [Mycena leptocephala]